MSEVRTIKRYSNRKLYDLTESRYVTLQEVAGFLQEGYEVQIIDNRTKEDITSVTLAQILYEQEKSKKSGLDLGTLKGIIVSSGELLQKKIATPVRAFKGEAEKTMSSFREEAEKKVTNLKEQAERMGKLFSHPREVGEEARAAVVEITQATQATLDDFSKGLDERFRQLMRFSGQAETEHSAELLGKLTSFEKRLAALEKKVAKLTKPASKRTPRTKK